MNKIISFLLISISAFITASKCFWVLCGENLGPSPSVTWFAATISPISPDVVVQKRYTVPEVKWVILYLKDKIYQENYQKIFFSCYNKKIDYNLLWFSLYYLFIQAPTYFYLNPFTPNCFLLPNIHFNHFSTILSLYRISFGYLGPSLISW